MRIGLFGGSFDPVHKGHENLVKDCLNSLKLDKVFIIPAFVSPFKVDAPPIASPKDRLCMLKLAFENEPQVEILTEEIDRKEISYTIDTLKKICLEFPKDQIFLLLSEELREKFSLWKNVEEIKKMAHIEFREKKNRISSTEIRRNLREGALCKNYLSAKVLDYIQKHQLYSS
ncbi:MAG: nicotinate-nicotinamide nucleotide adenylyltransferase [Chlamydiae bacterium]|jgi:nicotinate-nucleotide adenylyltransferase|nr:nicotinate-nicotinamide nucleotide adenylyltransferase [Chlamydiota bacterium]